MDQRIASNGNTTVWLIPATGIANYRSPTAAEINAGINATPAIAWDGTTFPTASDSDDVDDRSLEDAGNATTRGSAQFEATLNFFHPKVNTDNAGDFGKVYNFLRQPRVPVYVVTRVLQKPTEGAYKPAEAGDCPSSNDLEQPRWFCSGWLWLIGFRLCHLTLVVQAAVLDGLLFDAPPFSQDGFTATKVDVSWG